MNLFCIRVQSQVKDVQHDVETVSAARDEMANAAKEADKKSKSLEAELLQLQDDLAASEKARKAAQAERDELGEQINNSGANRCDLR